MNRVQKKVKIEEVSDSTLIQHNSNLPPTPLRESNPMWKCPLEVPHPQNPSCFVNGGNKWVNLIHTFKLRLQAVAMKSLKGKLTPTESQKKTHPKAQTNKHKYKELEVPSIQWWCHLLHWEHIRRKSMRTLQAKLKDSLIKMAIEAEWFSLLLYLMVGEILWRIVVCRVKGKIRASSRCLLPRRVSKNNWILKRQQVWVF